MSEASAQLPPPPTTNPPLPPAGAPLASPTPELLILNDLTAGVAHEHAGRVVRERRVALRRVVARLWSADDRDEVLFSAAGAMLKITSTSALFAGLTF
jgi:hypothetical protein